MVHSLSAACTIPDIASLDTWLYYRKPLSLPSISSKPGLQEGVVHSPQVSPSIVRAADLIFCTPKANSLLPKFGKGMKAALGRTSISLWGSFPLSGVGTWEFNTQLPQIISKSKELKYSQKCTVSALVHTMLCFQPWRQCFLVSLCTLYATLNTGRKKPGDFMRGRLAAELLTATTLQSSELTHLHEQIWTTLNNLFLPLYFTPVLIQRDISHATNLVLSQHNHMWRSQKNIIWPDNIVSIRKLQWGIKGKGITLNGSLSNLFIYLRKNVVVDR